MENSNNISKSLSGTASSSSNGDLGSVTSILSSSGTASTASSSDSSFFSYFQNITATTWIMIIIILAFLLHLFISIDYLYLLSMFTLNFYLFQMFHSMNFFLCLCFIIITQKINQL
jgi:hypothetical protein